MKRLDPRLAEALAGEATTLCRCWRLIRRDGTVQGFTDHDRDLAFEGTLFEAGAALEAGEWEARAGLAPDSAEVSGALSSQAISETDIAAGLYDGARVELWRVDWRDPAARLLERVATLGAITREDGAFRAELRGLSQPLDETRGRRFAKRCDADLGDHRCRVDLADPRHHGAGVIVAVPGPMVVDIEGLGARPAADFDGGHLRGPDGRALGLVALRAHGSLARAELWTPVPWPPGTPVTVTAGCDKRFSTCRDRFANAVNFRGFPHLPGPDFAFGRVDPNERLDGGVLVP